MMKWDDDQGIRNRADDQGIRNRALYILVKFNIVSYLWSDNPGLWEWMRGDE